MEKVSIVDLVILSLLSTILFKMSDNLFFEIGWTVVGLVCAGIVIYRYISSFKDEE